MIIRIATAADAAELLRIYAQYIHTPFTFEYELPSPEEFAGRITETLKSHPYLVAEEGRLLGYAYAHRFQARDAYQWGAELSIYLDRAATGRGLGRTLYERLIAILAKQEVRTVYGCVTTPNVPSEKLHERLGFRKVAHFARAGYKNGNWHDVIWFAKAIAAYDEPSPLFPFTPALFDAAVVVVGGGVLHGPEVPEQPAQIP